MVFFWSLKKLISLCRDLLRKNIINNYKRVIIMDKVKILSIKEYY